MHRVSSIPGTALAAVLLPPCGDAGEPAGPSQAAARAPRSGPATNAPSNLTASAIFSAEIVLVWHDNSTGELGFEIHISDAGPAGQFALGATTAPDVTLHADWGLALKTYRCYKVRALLANFPKLKLSDFSNTACATTPLFPPSMSSYTLPIERPGLGIEVTWLDGANTDDGFRIEQAEHPDSSWVVVGTVGANVPSFMTDLPLCYRVIAFNAAGNSPPSAPGCTAPAVPVGLTITLVDPDNFELTWVDVSAVEDTYEVGFGWGGCIGWVEYAIDLLPANSISYRTPTHSYPCEPDYFYVRALRQGTSFDNAFVMVP